MLIERSKDQLACVILRALHSLARSGRYREESAAKIKQAAFFLVKHRIELLGRT